MRKLTPAEQNWYGEKIRWFKQFRAGVPISEGFFPLGNWRQPGAVTWDGFARLSRQGEGLVVLFKNDAPIAQVEVKLPAFPDGSFHVRSVMTSQTLGTFSGEQFRRGITAHFPEGHKVEILEIRR